MLIVNVMFHHNNSSQIPESSSASVYRVKFVWTTIAKFFWILVPCNVPILKDASISARGRKLLRRENSKKSVLLWKHLAPSSLGQEFHNHCVPQWKIIQFLWHGFPEIDSENFPAMLTTPRHFGKIALYNSTYDTKATWMLNSHWGLLVNTRLCILKAWNEFIFAVWLALTFILNFFSRGHEGTRAQMLHLSITVCFPIPWSGSPKACKIGPMHSK